MKRNRITSLLLAFFMVFSLVGMFAQPTYALNSSKVGITTEGLTKWYDNETGKYCVKFTLNNQNRNTVYLGAYIYNADGKCVAKWTKNGEYYYVWGFSSQTFTFSENYSKFPSSSYTFVLKVKVNNCYNPESSKYEDLTFTWKWDINKDDACGPSIKFKKLTLRTLDDGRVVPRINIKCINIKGQSLTMYVYDDGDLIKKIEGRKRESNDDNAWFSWTGKDGNQQYPDGEYTVKIVSSGGLSIKKTFYLDFPYNN